MRLDVLVWLGLIAAALSLPSNLRARGVTNRDRLGRVESASLLELEESKRTGRLRAAENASRLELGESSREFVDRPMGVVLEGYVQEINSLHVKVAMLQKQLHQAEGVAMLQKRLQEEESAQLRAGHADGHRSEPDPDGPRRTPLVIREIEDLVYGEHERNVHCFGLDRPQCAFALSTLSGVSLPIGAALGIYLHPVHDEVVSVLLALGGGSLLFAVTVELYGHALHEVNRGRMAFWSEMVVIILGALVGSAFYTWANERLEEELVGQKHGEEKVDPRMVAKKKTLDRAALRDAAERAALSASVGSARRFRAQSRAKQLWAKVRVSVRFGFIVRAELEKNITNRKRALLEIATSEQRFDQLLAMDGSDEHLTDNQREEVSHAKALALSLFLGLVVDGIPECMLMGFLAAEERLNMVLVISLIIANFPEAFSSASLLTRARMSKAFIIGIWTTLMLAVGIFCWITCSMLLWAIPGYGPGGADLPLSVLIFTSFVEGLAGGAMITLIAAVILPEAMEKAAKTGPIYFRSGFCCASGFLLSVLLKVMFDQEH